MDLGLADRVALVTGATGGIGSAIAMRLADEGAHVVLGYHTDAQAAEDLTARLGASGATVTAVAGDMRRPETMRDMVVAAVRLTGRLDILVANAVAWGSRRAGGARFEDVDSAAWEGLISANLISTIELVRHAVRQMRGHQWGRIVLMSSHAARHGRWGHEYYAAAKVGLHGFAKSVAWDIGADNILINVVCPDTTSTPRVLQMLDAAALMRERTARATGNLVQPCDIAGLTAFLCSTANGSITGQVIDVSGGR
jgi:3-oxoacyl-[acyl-carrier protein] reductase